MGLNDDQNDEMTQLSFLLALAKYGSGGGGVDPSDVADAVREYLEAHPATKDQAGVVQIGEGIKVEDGVASLDEEYMAEMIADVLNSMTFEISDDEVAHLWD